MGRISRSHKKWRRSTLEIANSFESALWRRGRLHRALNCNAPDQGSECVVKTAQGSSAGRHMLHGSRRLISPLPHPTPPHPTETTACIQSPCGVCACYASMRVCSMGHVFLHSAVLVQGHPTRYVWCFACVCVRAV